MQTAPHVVLTPTPPHVDRAPWGASPGGSVVQTPRLPATSHASHWPAHALVQHTLSTQRPVPHSALVPHAAPVFFAQRPCPTRLHALSAPHEETVQQTPSVQEPL